MSETLIDLGRIYEALWQCMDDGYVHGECCDLDAGEIQYRTYPTAFGPVTVKVPDSDDHPWTGLTYTYSANTVQTYPQTLETPAEYETRGIITIYGSDGKCLDERDLKEFQ
jgi:hypothetical protein